MSTEPGNIEFERDPNRLDPSLTPKKPGERRKDRGAQPKEAENRETGEFQREHFTEIGEKVGEGGPKSAPADRQTDELMDFEREQQPVTGHQDRRHK